MQKDFGFWQILRTLQTEQRWLEDPALEATFYAGNPSCKEERYNYFKSLIPYFVKELKRKGVSKYLLWQEYRQQHMDGYGYAQFCFHLQQQLASERSMVLDHKPAEQLYIDFAGKKLQYVDKSTGALIECQVFVACLPFSDYCFAMAVPSQPTEDFLYALSRCLHHLGGVPPGFSS